MSTTSTPQVRVRLIEKFYKDLETHDLRDEVVCTIDLATPRLALKDKPATPATVRR